MWKVQILLILILFQAYFLLAELFPYGSGSRLYTNDDGYSSAISISTPFPYFGQTQRILFVCTNGIISFGSGVSTFTPSPFPIANNPVVAPFWGDVDTNRGGDIYYREIRVADSVMTDIEVAVHEAYSSLSHFSGIWAYLVTWHNVAAFGGGGLRNYFQAALITDGANSFVIFNYDQIEWLYGSYSDGIPAQVGFDAGDSTNSYAHPDSRTSDIALLVTTTNVGVPGRWAFSVGSTTIEMAEEVEIPPCYENECQHGSTCVDEEASYTCECEIGFEGTHCETNIDDCASRPCQNNATCSDHVNDYICNCMLGFTGVNCETDVDECESNPCLNQGTCMDQTGGLICQCIPGFNGTLCESNVNECASEPCLNGANCTDLTNMYTCECTPGFSGTNCETNIDDCAPSLCQNNATCTDHVNNYTCNCILGFTGVNCETDVDECESNPCQNQGTCMDQTGGFICQCIPGLNDTLCESNLNECISEPCLNGANCTDLINMYTCECTPGFSGTHCETNIDECASNPCHNNASCVDHVDHYTCTCVPGFNGDRCHFGPCEQYYITNNNETYCENNGVCGNAIATFENGSLAGKTKCNCTTSFTGDQCEQQNEQGSADFLTSNSEVAASVGATGAVAAVLGTSGLIFALRRKLKSGQEEKDPEEGEVDTEEDSIGSTECNGAPPSRNSLTTFVSHK